MTRRIYLTLIIALISTSVLGQRVEPLQEKFDNKVHPTVLIDSSLLKNVVLATNERGDKLMFSAKIDKNTYYVAIKERDSKVFYGVVKLFGKESQIKYLDILNGFKIIGKLVADDGKHEDVFMYTGDPLSTAHAQQLFLSEKFYGHNTSEDFYTTYSFQKNGIGKFNAHYNIIYRIAPQKIANSWRKGHRTHYSYSGGYYYDVYGTLTQSFTWKIKEDTIIINFGNSKINTKASLDEAWTESHYKEDLPYNEDVNKTKQEIKSALQRFERTGEFWFKYYHIDRVGIVLLPVDEDGCYYNRGFVLKGEKTGSDWPQYLFDAYGMFKDCLTAYAAYRKSLVTSNQELYNKFASNATMIFDYIMSSTKFWSIDTNASLNALLKVNNKVLDDGLCGFAGMTDYFIYDVDPNTQKANMKFIKQVDGLSKEYNTEIKFDENGLLIKDVLNIKFITESDNRPNDLKTEILETHKYIKKNKKNSSLVSDYKSYMSEYKKHSLNTTFKTFDEMEIVLNNLLDIIAIQEVHQVYDQHDD